MPDPHIRTQHLVRRVGDKTIVDDVSIDVSAGEVVAVMGPSGSGKSSLLRLVNRLDEPTSGTVFLGGEDYRRIPTRTLRRRAGMVLQQAFLFHGTVADNLQFGPKQFGRTLSDADVARLLDRVHLPGFQDRDVADLSGGEAQRVSLARTLANQPEVLLLDEPTSALDAHIKGEIEELLAEIIRGERLTCILVTHDAAQARRLADRVVRIVAGRLEGAIAESLADAP